MPMISVEAKWQTLLTLFPCKLCVKYTVPVCTKFYLLRKPEKSVQLLFPS